MTHKGRIENVLNTAFMTYSCLKKTVMLLMTYRKTLIRRIITKNVNVVINDVKKTSFMRHRDN